MRFDLTTLRLFVAVAEEPGIAGAARRENIAPSAISRRIHMLETQSNVQLFRRRRSGMELTDAGIAFYQYCRNVLVSLDQAQGVLDKFAGTVRGALRIAANSSATLQTLPTELGSFLALHPLVQIDLLEQPSDSVVRAVNEGAVDIGIFSAAVGASTLLTFPYRTDNLMLLVPSAHPLARRREITFSETLDYRQITLNSASPLHAQLQAEADRLGRRIDIILSATSFDAVRCLVQAGLGIGILPEACITPYESALNLRGIRLSDPWAKRDLRVCVREAPSYLPVKLFIDHICGPAALK